MIHVVIGLNIAIALLGFFLAWRIWQIKQMLTQATVMLSTWERHTQLMVATAPPSLQLLRSHERLLSVRMGYVRFAAMLKQLQQILTISLVVLRIWRRQAQLRPGRNRR